MTLKATKLFVFSFGIHWGKLEASSFRLACRQSSSSLFLPRISCARVKFICFIFIFSLRERGGEWWWKESQKRWLRIDLLTKFLSSLSTLYSTYFKTNCITSELDRTELQLETLLILQIGIVNNVICICSSHLDLLSLIKQLSSDLLWI